MGFAIEKLCGCWGQEREKSFYLFLPWVFKWSFIKKMPRRLLISASNGNYTESKIPSFHDVVVTKDSYCPDRLGLEKIFS